MILSIKTPKKYRMAEFENKRDLIFFIYNKLDELWAISSIYGTFIDISFNHDLIDCLEDFPSGSCINIGKINSNRYDTHFHTQWDLFVII